MGRQAMSHPEGTAICAWNGNVTYGELGDWPSTLASHLRSGYEVCPEQFVPVCLEKSNWTTVVMLEILKAGAACVLIPPVTSPVC